MPPEDKCKERYGFDYSEYRIEYTKRYGDYGPSESSDCHGNNHPDTCGCWVCRGVRWGLGKR